MRRHINLSHIPLNKNAGKEFYEREAIRALGFVQKQINKKFFNVYEVMEQMRNSYGEIVFQLVLEKMDNYFQRNR